MCNRTPAEFRALVNAWFAEHFHALGPDVPVALYNRLHAAKEELVVELTRGSAPESASGSGAAPAPTSDFLPDSAE